MRHSAPHDVYDRGSQLLCGLEHPLTRAAASFAWCCREAAIAYWGLCLHIGRPLPQNRHGHLIGHVKNTAKDQHSPDTRIYSTARAQPCAPQTLLQTLRPFSALPLPLPLSVKPH